MQKHIHAKIRKCFAPFVLFAVLSLSLSSCSQEKGYDGGRAYFEKNKTIFQQIVTDVKACRFNSNTTYTVITRGDLGGAETCEDGRKEGIYKIINDFMKTDIKSVAVFYNDDSSIESISFRYFQTGLLARGSMEGINYYENENNTDVGETRP